MEVLRRLKKRVEVFFITGFVVYLVLSVIVGGFFFNQINRLEAFKVNYHAKIINIFFIEYSHKLSDASDILKHLAEDENVDFSYLRGRIEEYYLNNTLTMTIAKDPNIFEDKEIGKIMTERLNFVVGLTNFLKKIEKKIIEPKNKKAIPQLKPDIEKIIFLLNVLNEDLQSFKDPETKKVYKEYEKEFYEYINKIEKKLLQ
ncbi:hypothetical protein ELD05_00445 [Caldicellulosiruptor changbaiensis]|uniref:Uncharacterized protein n=2 Tax=Caldicellulosiruptor changbaiensis TaxID=1222016 RepID=A0A3T0D9C1_9FIRM|nr:hypothetical protein ELD05_00445 [Caldicellulosiruptor changbaiensis]